MIGFRRLGNIAGLMGTILLGYSALFVVPILFALIYGGTLLPFVLPLGIAAVSGFALERLFPETELDRADGFLLVVLTWFVVSLLGALPYLTAGVGTVAHPINAIFESVSGFSCTGSTVMGEISLEQHSHAILIWRQLTQWVGGMGILVLAVAVLPRLSVGGAQFLDNEVPGPRIDRLTPHMAATAQRLWILYVAATALLIALALAFHYGGIAPKMEPYQAIAHAFTTLPSGGFSPQARSIEAFGPAIHWLIIPFMFVAATNFALLWRAIFSGPSSLLENTECKTYIVLFVTGGALITTMLALHGQYPHLEASARHGFFQLATILTTTGYASTDFAGWSGDVHTVLVALMFVSGCVGSTSGGLKLLRWIIGAKVIYREVLQRIHPSAVQPLRVGQRVLKSNVVKGALILIVVYLALVGFSTVLVAIDTHFNLASPDRMGYKEVLTSVAVTTGNIGPGLGELGPMENFEFLPTFSKLWMCLLMIAGRLEVMSILVLFVPRYWTD